MASSLHALDVCPLMRTRRQTCSAALELLSWVLAMSRQRPSPPLEHWLQAQGVLMEFVRLSDFKLRGGGSMIVGEWVSV